MRTTTGIVLLALAGALWTPVPVLAQDGAEAEVLAVVKTLFDGMREKDAEKIGSVFHPEARLHSAGVDAQGNPVTRETPLDRFAAGVASSQVHVDEVTFDEEVRIDGNLAMAWTPYNVFVDGTFQHCGVDVFLMTRTPDGWKILQLADTRTREGCDPERRG